MEKDLQTNKELQKEFWRTGRTIFWSLNAVILFTIVLDILIMSKDWLDFVLLKLFLLVFFYFNYIFFKRKHDTPNLLIHLILFSFNFLALISISYSGMENRIIYTSLLIALFIAFNTIAIWPTINSFIQYLLVIIIFALLVFTDIITNPDQILKEGGYLFLVLGFVSFFFPKIRKKILLERIETQIKANENINRLNSELSTVQANYSSIKEKVFRKDNESKFLFQQLSSDLNKIGTIISDVEKNTGDKNKNIEDLDALIQNLRNQSTIYFKPVSSNTNNTSYSTDVFDIKTVYLNVFKSFENQIEKKNITGTDNFLATNSLIKGNEKVFKTIIYNILNFMVIFSEENDKIEVTINNLNNNTIFSIANKTNGINSKEIESYFRDLEFVNYDYKKHSDSVKIGLRISKQLTQKMNGYFSYVSSKNMGFELKIEFETYKEN